MRYAVCMSGMMRGFSPWLPTEKIHRNMVDAFSGLPHDKFVSTWAIAGVQRGKIQNFSWRWPETAIDENVVRGIFGADLKAVQVLPFQPNRFTPDWLLEHARDEMHLSQRLACMYYHISEATRLKLAHSTAAEVRYDVTVRCRLDLDFNRGNVWQTIAAAEIKPNVVYVPYIESYGFTNDQFMFGDSDTMDGVASIYHHLCGRSGLLQYGPPHNPLEPAERLFQSYLGGLGVEVRRCHIDYIRCT